MFSNKITNIPQYKGLTVGNILKFARSKTNIDDFCLRMIIPKNLADHGFTTSWIHYLKILSKLYSDNDRGKKNGINRILKSWNNFKTRIYQYISKIQCRFSCKGKSHFLARVPKLTNDKIKIEKLEEEKKEEFDKKLDAYEDINDLKTN